MDHKSGSDDSPFPAFIKPEANFERDEFDDAETSEVMGMFAVPVGDNRVEWDLDDHDGRDQGEPDSRQSSKDETLEPGFLLRDRFEIVELVHSGGMGHVYKAIDKRRYVGASDKAYVAIKIMRRSLAPRLDARLALEREAAKTQHLSHPNIVKVYDFDEQDEQFYLVLEWLEGESVNALLRRTSGRRVAPQFAWQLIQGIAAGLQHAHANNVVHADINPSNIFITDTQEVRLLDFGVARYANDPEYVADNGPVWATRTYASPEVLAGSTPTFEDDIFSLACIGYRLLSGKHPFAGLSSIEAEKAGVRIPPIPGLSDPHWQILRSALSYARSDRPKSVSAFFDDLPAVRRAGLAGRMLGKPLGPWLDAVPVVIVAVAGALWWLSQSSVPEESLAIEEATPMDVGSAVIPEATNELSELEQLLSNAVQAMDEQRFVTPADDNARELYRKVLALDPTNSIATGGLRAISDAYVERASVALRAGAPSQANRALAIAGETDPLNRAIAIVDELLIAQGNGQLAKAQLAAAEGNPERALELLSDAERYAAVDVTAINAVKSQVALISAERDFLEALSIADAHINAGQLLAPAEGNAYASLLDLQRDHQGDLRLQASMERLGERLLARAAVAAVADRNTEATELLDAAEILGVLLPEVSAARQSLQSAVEEPAQPVIATEATRVRSLSDLEIEKFVTPRYPRGAKRRGLVGFVEVRFKVNEDGSTGEIESVRAEPGDVFASSAEDAVRKWRFAPRDDAVLAQVTLRFETDR